MNAARFWPRLPGILVLVGVLAVPLSGARAAPGLAIELNKVEDGAEGTSVSCREDSL